MIVTGKAVSAEQALKMGLIQLLADDPLGAAIALDDDVLEAAQAPDNLPSPKPNHVAAEVARAHVARRMPGQNAPQVAVNLVATSATTPLHDALASERSAFWTFVPRIRRGPLGTFSSPSVPQPTRGAPTPTFPRC